MCSTSRYKVAHRPIACLTLCLTFMMDCFQVGVDMSRFRAFPYRGSLLQSQNGAIQEVSHAASNPSQSLSWSSAPLQCRALHRYTTAVWSVSNAVLCPATTTAVLPVRAFGSAQVFHEPMSAKVLVERMELVRHIVDEAQRIAPDRISFHWSHPCQVALSGTSLQIARFAQRSLRVQAILP